MVECLLAKEEVASSNLVFRSRGDVAKWQGGGLQNPYSAVRIRPSPPAVISAGVAELADAADLKFQAKMSNSGFSFKTVLLGF